MAEITMPGMLLTGNHASRPAATAVGGGTLYACSDHTKVYQSDGASWSDWFDPSGLVAGGGVELDYAEITSNVTPLIATHTSGATAINVVSGNAVAYDGSTDVLIEFFSPQIQAGNGDGAQLLFNLFDGASNLGLIGVVRTPEPGSSTSNGVGASSTFQRRLTPSAATHTYHIKAWVTVANGLIGAGSGTGDVLLPAFIRITSA